VIASGSAGWQPMSKRVRRAMLTMNLSHFG
jgi:hypothetical protein